MSFENAVDAGGWSSFGSVETSQAFPAVPIEKRLVEKTRNKLHTKSVERKYDLIGPTLLRKREFDNIRRKQEAWINRTKQTSNNDGFHELDRTESFNIPEDEAPEVEPDLSKTLIRQESKLPFLIEPCAQSTTRKRRQLLGTNSRKSRRVSLLLGASSHQLDIKAATEKSLDIGEKKNHYKVLEFMTNKAEFEHLCHANAACKPGTVAIIKCFSCIKYDPLMQGHYCEACFKSRHPPYRTKHNWIHMDSAPAPLKQEWGKHMSRLDTERTILRYKSMLEGIKTTKNKNDGNKYTDTTSDKIADAKRKFEYVDETLYQIKKKLPKSYTREEAASIMQRVWRSRKGKREFIKLIKHSIKRLWDEETEQWYYMNFVTGDISLEKPRLLTLYDPVSFLTKDEAARRIQGMFYTRRARDQIKLLLQLCVEKHVDKSSQKVYYFNIRTKVTSWTKPAFLANIQVLTPRSRRRKARIQEKKDLGLFKSADTLTEEQAAVMIQQHYRIKKCREKIEAIMRARIRKVVDKDTGKVYYFNLATGETTWTAPKLLGGASDEIEEYKAGEKVRKVYHSKDEAAFALQGMYRRKKARERIKALLLCNFEKHLDENGSYYYYSRSSGNVYWTPPALLSEGEILTPKSRAKKEHAQQRKDAGLFKTAQTLTRGEAATMIIGLYRSYKARQGMANAMINTLRKVTDPETGEVYFFSVATGKTFWEKPSLLRTTSLSKIAEFQESEKAVKREKRIYTSDAEAASVLQGMWRARKARAQIRELLRCQWEKYLDDDTGEYYFMSRFTGAITWNPPALLSSEEIPTPKSRERLERAQKRKDAGLFKTAANLSQDQAATMIASLWNSYKARQGMAKVLLGCLRKIKDEETGQVYFYSVASGATFWEKPTLLRTTSLSLIADFQEGIDDQPKAKKKKREPRTFANDEEAALALQGMWRARKARKRLRELLVCQWEKHLDEDTGKYYFVSRATGAVTWTPPALLTEEDILTPKSREKKEKVQKRIDAGKFKTKDTLTQDEAAAMIQALWASYKARQGMAKVLLGCLRKITDEETGQIYFYSSNTGQAFWTKPTLLRAYSLGKIAAFQPGVDDQPPKTKKKKREPRTFANDEEAALALQGMWRAKKARDKIKDMLICHWEKYLDADSGKYSFMSKLTGAITWTPPALLSEEDILTPKSRERKAMLMMKKEQGLFKTADQLTEIEAALMIQRRFRAGQARAKLRQILASSISRSVDENGVTFYTVQGKSTYLKPTLLRDLSDSKLDSFRTMQLKLEQEEIARKKKEQGLFKTADQLTEIEAALMIQRRFRAGRARAMMREALKQSVTRARDEDGNVYYVIDGERATYHKPVLLKHMSDSKLASFKVLEEVVLEENEKPEKREPLTPNTAASKLQGMYRAKRARQKLREILLHSVERHVTGDGQEYFFNIKTGDSYWTKPKLLENAEVHTPKTRQRKEKALQKKEAGLFKSAQDMSETEAASLIQRRFRANAARTKLREALKQQITKALDPDGNVYYVIGDNATYYKPVLLKDLSDSQLISYGKLAVETDEAIVEERAPLTPNEAAKKLQGMYRAKRAREKLRELLLGCIEKHYDEGGNPYYVNAKTGEAQWEAPSMLSEQDVLTPRSREKKALTIEKKRAGLFRTAAELTEDEAAMLIQRLWKTRKARLYIQELAKAVYCKVVDPETGECYYYNSVTQESLWEKPAFLRGVSDSELQTY